VFTEKAIRALVKTPGMADNIVRKKRGLIDMVTAKAIGLYDFDGKLN
jgi:hypothetical protein